MFGLGPMELVIIFLIILLVFGAKRIPEIAQGLGKGINEFKKAAREVTSELDVDKTSTPTTHVRNELKGQPVQPPVEKKETREG
ncbi:twin-arginine translocase TatA/TatE family subunit [bacterium]|nr:twin-arginine translocase TatA/TatE family subunit [bacterium]